MHWRTTSVRMLTAALLCGGSSTVAWAQEPPVADEQNQEAQAPEGLADIVVTATRRSESSQKVPISISAISGDELANKGILNTADLASEVPNLQISSPFGKTQPNFILRGVSVANEFNSNQASPNGVYLDEVYLSSRFAQGMNLFDLERLEVVKGPQGTLYGRNTVGGAVNIVTRKAELGPLNGFVEAGYGNFNRYNISGGVGGTLLEDVLAVRLAGTFSRGDGQLPNNIPGNADGRTTRDYAIRGSILLKPSSGASFILRGYIGKSNPTSESPFVIGTGPGGVNPVTGYVRPANLGFFESDTNFVGQNAASGKGIALTSRFEIGTAEIVSVTAYDDGKLRVDQDPDGSPVDEFATNWRSNYKQFGQDLRLATNPDAPVRGIIGAYYGWDRNRTFNNYSFLGFAGLATPFGFTTVDHRFTQTRKSKAIYGEGNWDITDKLTLTAGLRYTWDDIELTDVSSTAIDANGVPLFTLVPSLAPVGSTCDTPLPAAQACPSPLATDFKKLTGRAILDYEITDDVLVYGSFSKGYRSGAINGTAYFAPAQLTFVEPEEVNAYEVGFKSSFLDRRIRLNASFFYYNYKNQQLQEVIGVVPFLRNAPKARAYGIDADLKAVVSDALTLNFGFGYLSSRYQELSLSGVDLKGNQFSNAPDLTFNASADITVLDQGDMTLVVRPTATYTGNTWLSPFNRLAGNELLRQQGYWTASIQSDLTMGNFTVGAYVRNLFEKKYFTYGLDLRNALGFDFLVRGERRTYGVNVAYKF